MTQYDLAGNLIPDQPHPVTTEPSNDTAALPSPEVPVRYDKYGRLVKEPKPAPKKDGPKPGAPSAPQDVIVYGKDGRKFRYDLSGKLIPVEDPKKPGEENKLLDRPKVKHRREHYTPPDQPKGLMFMFDGIVPDLFFRRAPYWWENVPNDVMGLKWNWGAFLAGRVWCFRHGQPLAGGILWGSLVVLMIIVNKLPTFLVPIVGAYVLLELGLSIALARQGYPLAWQSRAYDDLEDLQEDQMRWTYGGVFWGILWILFLFWLAGNLFSLSF